MQFKKKKIRTFPSHFCIMYFLKHYFYTFFPPSIPIQIWYFLKHIFGLQYVFSIVHFFSLEGSKLAHIGVHCSFIIEFRRSRLGPKQRNNIETFNKKAITLFPQRSCSASYGLQISKFQFLLCTYSFEFYKLALSEYLKLSIGECLGPAKL